MNQSKWAPMKGMRVLAIVAQAAFIGVWVGVPFAVPNNAHLLWIAPLALVGVVLSGISFSSLSRDFGGRGPAAARLQTIAVATIAVIWLLLTPFLGGDGWGAYFGVMASVAVIFVATTISHIIAAVGLRHTRRRAGVLALRAYMVVPLAGLFVLAQVELFRVSLYVAVGAFVGVHAAFIYGLLVESDA